MAEPPVSENPDEAGATDPVAYWIQQLAHVPWQGPTEKLLAIGEGALERLIAAVHTGSGIEPEAGADFRDTADSVGQALGALAAAHMPRFLELIQEKSRLDSSAIVWVLGHIDDLRVVPPLLIALRSTNSAARSSSARCLLAFSDPRIVEPMIAALRDRSNDVRPLAARALGALGDKRALEPLEKALAARINRPFSATLDAIADAISALEKS